MVKYKKHPSQELIKSVLNYNKNTGVFTWIKKRSGFKVGSVAGSLTKLGYVQIGLFGDTYLAHILAWIYTYGELPTKNIDHRNGIKSDNRIDNLREATTLQNAQNRSAKSDASTSGYRGVEKRPRGRWAAKIVVDGVVMSLGIYNTPEEASKVGEAARKKLLNGFSIEAI